MAQVSNFFAGANSGDGFQTLFPGLVDPESTRDFMILKGGPGVGKATFMRALGRRMEQAGTAVEYLWCSGDPESLDGVLLPELHCGVVDGTVPHLMEPAVPAAVDRIVDLGQFYDLEAMKLASRSVRAHLEACQRAHFRACRAMKAARQVELEAVSEVKRTFDRQRALRRAEGICSREFRRKGPGQGRTQYRFLGSLTHRGYIWRFDSVDALCPRVYELSDRWELAGELLDLLHRTAVGWDWDVIACMAPEEPKRMEHLLIPELGLAFISTRPGMEYGKKAFRHIRMDAMAEPENRAQLRFQSRMAKLLREEGVRGLKVAKESHDLLEADYHDHVDFQGVTALAALETGRWLHWMEA